MGLERAPFFTLAVIGGASAEPGAITGRRPHRTRLTGQPAFCTLVAKGGIFSNSGPDCDCICVRIA